MTRASSYSRSICGAAAVAIATALPSLASAELIDRVVAVIDDRPVLLSEVRQRAAPFLPATLEAASESQREKQVADLYARLLEQRIDELLLEREADRLNVRVTQEDIERAIGNIRNQSGLDEDGFWRAVEAQGMTRAQYIADLRKRLLELKVENLRLRGQISIGEEQLRERYAQKARQMRLRQTFNVAHVFIAVPETATPAQLRELDARAREVRQRIQQRGYDTVGAELGGSELGWVAEGELAPELEDALRTVSPGQVTPVVRASGGLHILVLRDRKTLGGSLEPFEQARDGLYRELFEELMAQHRQSFLRELRAKAVIQRRLPR